MTAASHRATRINARLDADHAEKIEYLKRATGLPVSDLVKRGIDLLFEGMRNEARPAFEILTETGFIGSGSAPPDLSDRYKDDLAEILAAKHGDR
jgi:hypothetical protein